MPDHRCRPRPPRGRAVPRRRCRRPPTSPAGPAPTMTTSKTRSSSPAGAPAASAIWALDGSLRTRPSGSSISGSARVGARPGEQLAPLVRFRQEEGMRDRAALEDLPQLIGPARPRLGDDVNRLRNEATIPSPTRAGSSTRPRGRPRRANPSVWARSSRCAQGPSSRGSRRRSADPPRRPAEPTARAWRASEADAPARAGDCPIARENAVAASTSATSSPPCASPFSVRTRLVRIGETLDAIVACVPLDELGLEALEGLPILVDRDQERLAHREAAQAARRLVGHEPNPRRAQGARSSLARVAVCGGIGPQRPAA